MKIKSMIKIILPLLLSALLLCGCAGREESAADGYSFTDALGYTVTVKQPARVAALYGSFAETWLLAGGSLAAVTDDAISERGIDGAGQTAAGGIKEPSAEAVIAAGCDFAILSANISDQTALRETLESAGVTCAYFDVETFDDYLQMLKICTDITGKGELYELNGLSVKDGIDAVVGKASQTDEHPAVLLLRSYGSGVKAKNSENNMTGAMLRELGCVNIADGDGSGLLEELSLEAIIDADPDFIFVTSTGSYAFRLGGVAGASLSSLALPAAVIALALAFVLIFHHRLDVLALGDDSARSLGLRAGVWRFAFLAASALAVGAVSFAGLIGFVGLIVPHAVRFFTGSRAFPLILSSAALGGAFLTLCDVAARSLFRPYELAVGILLAFIGGPLFLALLISRRRRGQQT